jgi:glycosyltransferase involved in cell wall biosynthesis
MNMRSTVIVSCYNQENYINECLQSIIDQETDFEFDILVSDDCSTDGTQNLIALFQQKYPHQIKVIQREKNVGTTLNYLDAHKQATGDIVFHFDGDDVMLPGKLQKQFQVFRDNEQVNLVFHRAQYFSDDGSYLSDTGTPSNAYLMYFDANDLALWGSITVHSAYAYRKSARKFTRSSTAFMEWFFAMDCLLPEGKGVYIDEILVKYRCNINGNTFLSTKKGRLRAYKTYFDDVKYYFSKYPFLRKNLYSNAVVTLGGTLQSRCFPGFASLFFIKNIFYFNLSKFKNTIRMRRAVAPVKKIR